MVKQPQIYHADENSKKQTQLRWQRIGLAIAFGAVVVMLAGIAVDRWRVRNGWCASWSKVVKSSVSAVA